MVLLWRRVREAEAEYQASCYVQVIYRDDEVGAAVRDDLLYKSKSRPYNGIQSWRLHTLHSKYLVFESYYNGAADQKVVWTGSHNYTRPALRFSDEVLLRITD